MKKIIRLLLTVSAVLFLNTACTPDGHDHDHDDGHDHDHGHEHGDHDHGGHDHDGHDHDHEHDNEGNEAGPNGGRMLTSVKPGAEFYVMKDRKVQITFVGEEGKIVPAVDQQVSAVGGDRSSPTELSFTKRGDVLVSDKPLPEGNDFPVVVSLVMNAGADPVREKFNVNLSECPSCENLEYACICGH